MAVGDMIRDNVTYEQGYDDYTTSVTYSHVGEYAWVAYVDEGKASFSGDSLTDCASSVRNYLDSKKW